MLKEKKSLSDSLSDLMAVIVAHFLGALFMWWGWNVIAPLLMLTTLTYWEMLAVRLGICTVINMFEKSNIR